MSKLSAAARKFVNAEEGATVVDYGLMVALIAAFLFLTIRTLCGAVSTQFTLVTDALAN
jgi:Flp pilus assembly pilin Flp